MQTMKVKPWGAGQGDHVVINREDFNPAVHEPLDPVDVIVGENSGETLSAVSNEQHESPVAPAKRGRKAKAE
jgi:hypothetical protein